MASSGELERGLVVRRFSGRPVPATGSNPMNGVEVHPGPTLGRDAEHVPVRLIFLEQPYLLNDGRRGLVAEVCAEVDQRHRETDLVVGRSCVAGGCGRAGTAEQARPSDCFEHGADIERRCQIGAVRRGWRLWSLFCPVRLSRVSDASHKVRPLLCDVAG